MELTLSYEPQCKVCQEPMRDGDGGLLRQLLAANDLPFTVEGAATVGLCICCHQVLPERYLRDRRRFRGLKLRWEKLHPALQKTA